MEHEALIAYLVSKTEIMGKKALQKLVYFCMEAGVPLYARYRFHIYGPYSNEVAEELGEAISKEIIRVSKGGYSFYFTKGTSCNEYVEQYREEIEQNREKIDKVLRSFGKFTPFKLELYSTVHFIASSLQEAYGEVTEEQIIDEVVKAKGEKFSIDRIKKAYQDLIANGWLTGKQ